MATTYPTTKQVHTKPNPSDSMQTVSHSGLHRDLSHTVEALEDKVGINGDTSHSSHDYKLSNITGADKAASNSGYSSHAADSTIHFTEASINHLNIQNKGTKTHAQIDTHINSTSNPHSTTHAQLPDKGTNAHSAIDTHISSTSNPHSTTLAQVGGTLDHTGLTNKGTNTHSQIDSHIGDGTIHFTEASIDHDNITNTHNLTTDIDHDQLTNTHNLGSDIDHTQIQNIGTLSHAELEERLGGGASGASTHALTLNGTTQYAEITDAAQTGLDLTNAFTIEFWLKTTTSGQWGDIVTKTDGSTYPSQSGYSYYIEVRAIDNRLSMVVSDGTNTGISQTNYPITFDGTWHHYACVWQPSHPTQHFVYYKDGVFWDYGTNPTTVVTSLNNTSVPVVVGAITNGGSKGNFFNGSLDEVRVWNDVRTAQEIADNYRRLVGSTDGMKACWKFDNNYKDASTNNNDLTAYNSPTFTTSIFPDPDHTKLANIGTNTHAQIDTAISNSVSHIASTAAHGATGANVGTTNSQILTNKTFDDEFRAKQIATPSNPASGYNKLYFKSDDKLYKKTSAGVETEIGAGGGGGLAEIDTTLYHGYVLPTAATPVWTKTTAGTPTEAITADDKLHIATDAGETIYYEYNDTALDNAKGYTVETRMRVTADESTYEPPLFAVEDDQYAWWVNISSTQVSIGLWGGDVFGSGNDKEYALDGTEWHTYRVTVKGTDLKLYVDGILRIWGTIGTETSTNQTIYFGYWNTDIATDIYVDYIYLRHYDQIVPALNDSSAISMIRNESPLDSTNQNTHSLDLEIGSSQYAQITDASQAGLDLTNNFTLECWIRLESLPPVTSYFPIFKDDAYGLSLWDWNSDSGASGLKMRLYLYNPTFATGNSIAYTFAINTWYHIAVTFASSTTKFYINGVQLGTDVTHTYSVTQNSAGDFNIGGTGDVGYFDGLVDDVRVWNVVRSASDILNNKDTQNITSSNLKGHWKLNNDYLDASGNNNTLTAYNSPVFSSTVPFTQTLTNFDLDNTPLTDTLRLYLNGQRLEAGVGNDYTLSGKTITMANSLSGADKLIADYEISSGTFATGSASWVTGELVNETPTGSLAVFTVDNDYVPNSTQVYVDGQLQNRGASNDYTESDPSAGEITFTYNPSSGSTILVTYQHAVSTAGNADMVDGLHASDLTSTGYVLNEVPSGSINGSNTLFTLSQSYVAGGLQVYRDGQLMKLTDDYTETSASAGTFTFVTAPVSGTNIVVSYKHATTVGGLNADTLDGFDSAYFMPKGHNYKARAYRATSTWVIPQTTMSLCQLNAESYDPNSNFASYLYTVPVTGYYLLNGASGIYNPSPASVHHYLRFVKNGSATLARYNSNYTNVSYLTMNLSTIAYLTSGDTVGLYYETGDDNCELLTGDDTSFFEAHLLST